MYICRIIFFIYLYLIIFLSMYKLYTYGMYTNYTNFIYNMYKIILLCCTSLSYGWSTLTIVNVVKLINMVETIIDPCTSLNWSKALSIHLPHYI